MRFYGICVCLVAAALLLFPLMAAETVPIQEQQEQNVTEENQEVLVAVVGELPTQMVEDKQMGRLSISPVERIDFFQIKNSSTKAIDTVAVEEYVLGAVCSEMPASFHLEALKAQAVSARTWAVYQQLWQKEHPDEALDGADFQADPSNWKGYVTMEQAQERFGEKFNEYWSILTQAMEETRGQILCFEEAPIAAAYHAISAGSTEAAEYVWGSPLPYLQAVSSIGDELSPGYEVSVTFTKTQLAELLSVPIHDLWLEITEWSPSGYVTKILTGTGELSGTEFRSLLGLRSSSFTIAHEGENVIITTHGYGHGAGLSQYGADFMARQGNSYQEILAHYYPNTELCCW